MAHRDFDAFRKERQRTQPQTKVRPVSFTLGEVTFECIRIVPTGLIFDIAAAPEYDANPMGALAATRDFICGLVVPAQREEFLQVLRREDDPGDFETLEELAKYLSEEFLNRPTGPSSGSPDGRHTTGPISKRVSLSKRTVEAVETS